MNRLILKERAKSVLRSNYWTAFLVSFIVSLLSGGISSYLGSSSSSLNIITNLDSSKDIVEKIGFTSIQNGFTAFVLAVIGSAFVFVFLGLMICYMIFVVSPLLVGNASFFLEARKKNSAINSLFFGFAKDRYKNAVFVMFMRNLFVFLWSLLFIIPGIYFSYAYCLVPYLLAENPSLDYKKALDLSRKITDGNKLDIFVMEISFIGWYLLGSLVIIGGFFVNPYKEAALAEMYVDLRDMAIEQGKISYSNISPQ